MTSDFDPIARRDAQRRFWRERYREDPSFFGEGESPFSRWCMTFLRAEPAAREVIELGGGYGRDARFFAEQGFRVRGVELALTEAVRGRSSRNDGAGSYELFGGDAFEFLRRATAGSADVVYSNMFYNMDFREREHVTLFELVGKVLRPGGLHLYSARSSTDPWYGRGEAVAPDTYRPDPGGIALHFFSAAYAERLGARAFSAVERIEVSEGSGDFPVRLLYVADRSR